MFEFSDAFQCRRGQGASLQRQVGGTDPGYYGLIKALLNIPQSQFFVKYTNTAFTRCCFYYQLFISASSLTSVKYVNRTKMSYSVEFDRNVTLYSFSQFKYEAYLPIHNQIFCLSDSVNIHACNGPQTWLITDFLECIMSSFWSGHFNKDHKKDLVFTEFMAVAKDKYSWNNPFSQLWTKWFLRTDRFMLGLEEVNKSGRKTRRKEGRW